MTEKIFIYNTDKYGNPGSYAIPESEIQGEWASLAEVLNWDNLPEGERPTLTKQQTYEDVDGWRDQYVDNDGEIVYIEKREG